MSDTSAYLSPSNLTGAGHLQARCIPGTTQTALPHTPRPLPNVHLYACLAATSAYIWCNLPVALVAVLGLRWLHLNTDIRFRGGAAAFRRAPAAGERLRAAGGERQSAPGALAEPAWPPVPPAAAAKSDGRWRDAVRAPLVEHAWETLCGSIVQEVRSRSTAAAGSCARGMRGGHEHAVSQEGRRARASTRLKPIGNDWPYSACRIGHLDPI
jgi:hypothetical protein